jgi:uncharacterized membrane protein YebE (DUF533 family)
VDQLSGTAAQNRSVALLRALIAAAKADGHIDVAERAKINDQLRHLDLDAEIARFIDQEIARPLDVQEVAAGADSPEGAAEIYLASLLVIDDQNPAERSYLDELARALGLAPDLVTRLEAEVAN